MKILLWGVVAAALLFFIFSGSDSRAPIPSVTTKPSEAELRAVVAKIWAACEAQFNSKTQSKQFVDCVDRMGGAYVAGYETGRK